jgi:hypothetical protein
MSFLMSVIMPKFSKKTRSGEGYKATTKPKFNENRGFWSSEVSAILIERLLRAAHLAV